MKLISLGIFATTVWASGCPWWDYSRDGHKCCHFMGCWAGERDYNDCGGNGGCSHYCNNQHHRSRTCSCRGGYYSSGTGCYCHTGFQDTGSCTNINECNGSNNCHSYATCTDTHGSYTCACEAGYIDHYGNGNYCTNKNECTQGGHNCHAYASCSDRTVHYHNKKWECTCDAGYNDYYGASSSRRGENCYNRNECTEGGNNCHADAICTDKTPHYHGGLKFTCACKSGFTDNGYGTHCTDRDECTNGEKRCDPVAMCTNTHGDHTCECPVGYTDPNEDGTVCQDIDECADNPCHGDAVCTNTVGSYHCDCNEGYQGEGHECTLCHGMSTWKSEGDDVTKMDVACTCNDGYQGDGDLCEDINECEDGTHLCDPNATCTNTIASHYCTCNVGYYGFGQTCTACDPETKLSEMVFECASDEISVTIPYCAFYNEDITNHAFLGTGDNCTMENTGINVEMSIPTTSECGTIVTNNGTYLLYSNAIIGDVRESDGAVSRKKFIDLDFECGFEADFDVSSDDLIHAMIDHVEILLDRQDKEFDIQMGVFTDDTFTEIVHEDYSITVPDIIHAAVQLMDGEDTLVLLAEKCWATPSSDPEDATQYVFLDNFCSAIDVDGIFNMGRNGIDRNAQFELESFEFDGHLDGIIYLHCHANVCDTELEDCSIDCTDSRRRRRRSIGETSAALRVGPIRVIDPNQ